jgi:hypothetical protein
MGTEGCPRIRPSHEELTEVSPETQTRETFGTQVKYVICGILLVIVHLRRYTIHTPETEVYREQDDIECRHMSGYMLGVYQVEHQEEECKPDNLACAMRQTASLTHITGTQHTIVQEN